MDMMKQTRIERGPERRAADRRKADLPFPGDDRREAQRRDNTGRRSRPVS